MSRFYLFFHVAHNGLCKRSSQLLLAIDGYALCVPGMGSPRYKDSEFSKWCKSTGSELVKLPSKPQSLSRLSGRRVSNSGSDPERRRSQVSPTELSVFYQILRTTFPWFTNRLVRGPYAKWWERDKELRLGGSLAYSILFSFLFYEFFKSFTIFFKFNNSIFLL